MDDWRRAWLDPALGESYGKVLFDRATGASPEMESSKASARQLGSLVTAGDQLLDVGCGVGHYLRSYRRMLGVPFGYTGVDATPLYVELARKAHEKDTDARFQGGDVFALPFADRSFDVVTSNNLLLHLPSIATPIRELCRVARKHVVIRMLAGDRTHYIRDAQGDGCEFHESGEPVNFHFYNIYSKAYVGKLLSAIEGVLEWSIADDRDFDPDAISAAVSEQPDMPDVTRMNAGWQVNGYILQPWAFVKVTKRPDVQT